MTYEEAIKNIKEWRDFAEKRGSYYGEEAIPTYNLAIEALEKDLRQNKQYSAADKLLPVIEYVAGTIVEKES